MNGKVKVLLVVASLFCITSPALASASCQTKNDLKVCFYEKYTGISHHVYNISVEDLNGPPPDSINISTLIDSTNFPASKIHDAKLYSYENITYTEKVFDHYKYVNGTLHDNGTVEDYNATHLNYTVNSNSTFVRKHRSPGAYDWSAADNWWTENESRAVYRNEERWEWRWQRAKEQYFKRNAERFTQGMGTFKIPPNPKWFRYEFDTPIQPWSKGRFALNVNDMEFDPWWNATWKYRRNITFTEQSGNDLTNYPVGGYWIEHGGHAQPDCDDVRVISPSGDEIKFNSTLCNSTHVKLVHKINVSANSDVDYQVYYGNPDATQSAKEVVYDRVNPAEGMEDTWEDGNANGWVVADSTGGSGAVTNSISKYGSYSYNITTDADGDTNWFLLTRSNFTISNVTDGDIFSAWWRINRVDIDDRGGIDLVGPTGKARLLVDVKNSRWHLATDITSTDVTTPAPEADTWYRLMIRVNKTNNSVECKSVYANGTDVFDWTSPIGATVDFDTVRIAGNDQTAGSQSKIYLDDVSIKHVDPDPAYTVGAEETSPEIQRVSVPDVHKDEDFLVRVKSFCIDAPCLFGDYNLTLELPSGFTIPDDKLDHSNPRIDKNRSWVTTWEVKAPSTTGTYLLNVSGPINEVSNEIRVKRNIFDIEDMIKTNLTEEIQNRWQELNATYLNKTELERQVDTRSIIKENLTKELQNRWQNLNASYLNGTAIERVRKLADYLNQTRWGSYIASDLYEVANDAKTIARYINETRWLDKTASDLYEMSKEANSTAEKARKIAEYVNESRWLDKTATDLYDMADQANSTAELAREIADYINRSRWIDKTAPDIYDMAREANDTAELARNLAEYINESRWTEDNATVLYDIADQANSTAEKARKIADYINQSRWQTFKLSTKDSFELGWDGWVSNPVGLPTGTAATRTTDWASHKNWSVNLGDIANKMMNTSRDLTMIEKIVFDWRITNSDQRIQFHIDGKEKASITGTPAPRTETEVIDVSDLVGAHELTFYGETTVSGAPCYTDNIRFIPFFYEDISEFSKKARDLADYINGTRWGKYVAEDLRNMSDKARKIAQYINETRWKGFVAKDIFAEAESARKEAERTYEEMHDLKRVLIKEMRKTILRALGIKGPPSSHSSSSSSPGGSSVPSSSPKTLPTGKATESKSRGIVGGVVHFFARGVRGLTLIAQSVMGG